MIESPFLSINDLSKYIGIRPKTLYTWAEKGKIPAYKINGALRFNLTEINDFIQKGRIKPLNVDRMAKKMIGKTLQIGHNSSDSGQRTPR